MTDYLRNYGHTDTVSGNGTDPYCVTGYIVDQGAYILGDS